MRAVHFANCEFQSFVCVSLFFNNTFNFRSANNDQIFKVRAECDLMTFKTFYHLQKKLLTL